MFPGCTPFLLGFRIHLVYEVFQNHDELFVRWSIADYDSNQDSVRMRATLRLRCRAGWRSHACCCCLSGLRCRWNRRRQRGDRPEYAGNADCRSRACWERAFAYCGSGQVEHEARAKISWGDAPEEVVKYLRIQGLSHQEASSLVQAMFKERAETIRRNGIRKVLIGIALMCVPVVAFFIFTSIGFIPLKPFAVTLMIGVWGAWMVLKGTIMFLAPKSEPGDVAEQ